MDEPFGYCRQCEHWGEDQSEYHYCHVCVMDHDCYKERGARAEDEPVGSDGASARSWNEMDEAEKEYGEMYDREKVIKGLEEISDYFFMVYYHSEDRKETNRAKDMCDTAEDAIALLKEQEAVEPIKMQRMDDNFSFFVPYFLCGNCRYELVGKDVMFCSHCGRAVKWNDSRIDKPQC